jgi:hypothetical protein
MMKGDLEARYSLIKGGRLARELLDGRKQSRRGSVLPASPPHCSPGGTRKLVADRLRVLPQSAPFCRADIRKYT